VYRAHNPRWSFSPHSGDGAARYGGRFNVWSERLAHPPAPACMLNLDPGNKSMHRGVSRCGPRNLLQKSRQQKACCGIGQTFLVLKPETLSCRVPVYPWLWHGQECQFCRKPLFDGARLAPFSEEKNQKTFASGAGSKIRDLAGK
jgi:hypothetical protein